MIENCSKKDLKKFLLIVCWNLNIWISTHIKCQLHIKKIQEEFLPPILKAALLTESDLNTFSNNQIFLD